MRFRVLIEKNVVLKEKNDENNLKFDIFGGHSFQKIIKSQIGTDRKQYTEYILYGIYHNHVVIQRTVISDHIAHC